ncbi:DUF3857 domain-containing protein [Flavilitoribacter nigricans]|nr:DUF3857 domain-containing protein [Flavilitoribacter nigricans]
MEWGTIPPVDRIMEVYAEDPEAGAVILGEIGQFFFRNESKEHDYQLNVHKRIKLLDKKPVAELASVSIPYYHFNDSEWIISIDAQTITPDGRVHSLSRKDFYFEKRDAHWTHVNFTFPQLQEGAILEYRYSLRSNNVVQPRTWYFQHSIPTRFSQLSLHNSSYLSFATLFEGAEYMELKEKTKNEIHLVSGKTRFLFSDQFYLMENAPAIREEAYMTTIDDYRVRLRLQLSEIIQPGDFPKAFLPTWEQAAHDLIDSPFFGGLYLAKKSYRKLNRILLNNLDLATDPERRMRQIYQFLVTRIHWNGLNGVQPERELYDAFQTGKASTAELNFMLLALLHAQNIVAHPVLTSTRQHGRMTQQYPLMDQFNYVMVLVSIGGRTWLLDPTDPLRPPGMPGLQTLNKKAWVVNPEWPQWINLEVPPCRDRYTVELQLDASGALHGRMQARYSSYSALLERKLHRQAPKGHYWSQRLQRLHPEAMLDSVQFLNATDLDAAFEQQLSFYIPDAGQSFGNFLYLPLVVYANFSENPFKQKNRNFPVDFPYPFEEEWQITLDLPPNYEVVELPKSTNYSLPDHQGEITYECKQEGKKILLDCRFTMRSDFIEPALYPHLKQLFSHYLQQVHAKVVLKKNQ